VHEMSSCVFFKWSYVVGKKTLLSTHICSYTRISHHPESVNLVDGLHGVRFSIFSEIHNLKFQNILKKYGL
jgi:hypothetical protein